MGLAFVLCVCGVGAAQAETIRVEAEEYTAAYDVDVGNNGGSPSNCVYGGLDVDDKDTADGGGGCIVGWNADGEWLDYAISPAQAGTYRITYRYSSGAAELAWAGQLLFKQGGITLSTVNLLGTGGWGVFWESTAIIELAAGAQTVRLEFSSPNFDINWFELELKTVYITDDAEYRIEVEDYNNAYDTNSNNAATDAGSLLTRCPYYYLGVDVFDTSDGGGCGIGYISSGEWLEYSINVSEAAPYTLKYRYATGGGAGGDILFKVDGSTAQTTTASTITGDWDIYTTATDTVDLSAGEQTIRVEFSNPSLNMNWFSLEKAEVTGVTISANGTTKIEFEDYVAGYDTTAGNSATAPTNCDYGGSDVDVGDLDSNDCAVGYIANGEWLEYDVYVEEAGDYTLAYQYGSPNNSPGQIQFFIDGGYLISTTLTTNTGGYNTYTNQTDTVTLPAGGHTIRTQFINPILNLNWFSLESVTSTVITIASRGVTEIGFDEYVSAYDTTAGNEASAPTHCPYNGFDVDVFDSVNTGDCAIGYVADGETLDYDVEVIEAGDYTLSYSFAGEGAFPPGDVIFKVDGATVLTTTLTTTTGDFGIYATETDTVTLPAGLHTITLEFSNPWFNAEWFSFEKVASSTITIANSGVTQVLIEEYVSGYDNSAGNGAGTSPLNCTYNGYDVDIYDSVSIPNDCALGYIGDSESLDYDVDVIEAGDYTLTYRFAGEGTNPPGDIIFKVDGATVLTTTLVTTTGGWEIYASDTDTVTLPAGLHTITIEFSDPWLNVDWFSFEKVEAPGAGSCSFPGVAASASDAGQVIIHSGGTIHDAPNNQVVTKNISSDANGCGSGVICTKTDTVAPAFTDIPAFPAGTDVIVAYGETYNFTPGAYGSVNINSDTTLNFAPGDYTFTNSLTIGSGSTVNVSSPGLVRIFIDSGFAAAANVTVNAGGGTTEFLFIYALTYLNFESGSSGRLIGYTGGDMSLHNNADVTGALTSASNLTVQFGANLRYDESYIAGGGFGEACGGGSSGVESVGTWRFDDPLWNGTGGEVKDSSGNGLHANTVDAGTQPTTATASPALVGDPGSCGYGEFDGSGYVSITDPGTGSVFDSPEYTLSGWFYPTSYPGADYYTLASKDSHFEMHVAPSGSVVLNWDNGLSWDVLSSTGTLPLNTWTHVAYSYTFSEQKIYINGVLDTTGAVANGYVFNDANMLVGYDSAPTTRGFRGRIEEFNFYDSVLSASDVAAVAAETHDCPNANRTPVAEWRFDDAGWDGTADEVVDSSGNNLHGVAASDGGFPNTNIASPAIGGDPGTCRYGEFDLGNNGYVAVADPGADSFLDVTEFTLSMWVYPNAYPPFTLGTLITKDSNFELHLTTGGQVKFEWFSFSTWHDTTTAAALPLNQWSHVAVSYEQGEQKIYIDGALTTSTTNINPVIVNNDPIGIGYDLNPTNRALDGHLDEVRLYGAKLTASEVAVIAAEIHVCPVYNTPDHILITVDGTASTCAPETVTFTVNNGSSDPLTDYAGTLTLSTSTGNGDWSKTGTASDAYGSISAGAGDSGAATYTFDASDNGTVTLQLETGRTESLTVSAVDSEAGATGTSGSVAYSTNGFTRVDITGGTQIVGYPQVWKVEMKKQDPDTGDCATNTEYSQVGVKAWLDRSAADPNGTAPTFVDAASGDSLSVPSSEPGSNNFDLTFVNGVARFTANTTDVGMYNFYIADKTRSFADVDLITESGVKTHGPFGYYVSVVSNPAATTAGGAAFNTAGASFRVNVSAVAWQAGDDLDDDKVPDGHDSAGNASRANLADNTVIASFGQETPVETITLSSGLLLPAGGSDPGLKDEDTLAALARTVDSFAGGSGFIERVYFDEVGIIEIKAEVTDGWYLGKNVAFTEKSQSYSANVGRFTPANFTFSSGALTAACQTGLDYSYMGQGFTGQFVVSPKSSRGGSLQNYTGDFVKLVTGDFDFVARDINTATALTARLSGAATGLAWSGDGTVDANFTLARAASPDGPYTTLSIGTDFDDTDGIGLAAASKDLDSNGDASNDSAELEQTEVRFGRLRLGDALGPETAPLSIPLLTEYWDSPSWLQNDDDSCTTIARSEITYPGGTITTEGNRTVTVGAGTTVGSYGSIVGDAVSFVGGDAVQSFSAPGTGNTGNFNTSIDLTSYPWLRFDWNGDGDYSDTETPDNQINFGIYRGHDRMIYWREY